MLYSANILFFPQRELTSEQFWIKLCKQMDKWKNVISLTVTPLPFYVSQNLSWMLPSLLLTQQRPCKAVRWEDAFWCGWSSLWKLCSSRYVQWIADFFLTSIFLKMQMSIEVIFKVAWYLHRIISNYTNTITVLY